MLLLPCKCVFCGTTHRVKDMEWLQLFSHAHKPITDLTAPVCQPCAGDKSISALVEAIWAGARANSTEEE
jgi:hypothetical protein